MAPMKRPRLKTIEVLSDYRIKAHFIDDSLYTIDFKPLFEESTGLLPLKNAIVFATAQVDPFGWLIEWQECDIQIGADTLWLDAQAQNAPDENTRIFVKWRVKHGLSLSKAAEALGLTSRTISYYGTGKRPVPRYIALACQGWEIENARSHYA